MLQKKTATIRKGPVLQLGVISSAAQPPHLPLRPTENVNPPVCPALDAVRAPSPGPHVNPPDEKGANPFDLPLRAAGLPIGARPIANNRRQPHSHLRIDRPLCWRLRPRTGHLLTLVRIACFGFKEPSRLAQ